MSSSPLPIRAVVLAFLAGAAVATATAWWLCGASDDGRRPKVEIVRDGTPSTANFGLLCEHWSEPSLAELARAERLDRLIPEGASMLEQALTLTAWTSSQWQTGVPDPYPKSNALDILREIRAGRTSGFCGQYAYVLADALKTIGLLAVRYVELWTRDLESHFTVEVWLDDLQKWVLLEPWLNVYYRNADGEPMSALELHDLAVEERWQAAQVVALDPRPTTPRLEDHPHAMVDYYYHLAVSTRSDYMRHARPVTVDERFATFVYLVDPRIPSDQRLSHYRLRSSRRADFDYPIAQTYVTQIVRSDDGVRIEISTKGTTPSFLVFETRIDGGPWQALEGASLTVPGSPRRTVVELRSRNHLGRAGKISEVVIQP